MKEKTATNAQEKVIEGKRENFRWLVVKNSTAIFQHYQTIIILQIKKLSEIVKYFKSGALINWNLNKTKQKWEKSQKLK